MAAEVVFSDTRVEMVGKVDGGPPRSYTCHDSFPTNKHPPFSGSGYDYQRLAQNPKVPLIPTLIVKNC